MHERGVTVDYSNRWVLKYTQLVDQAMFYTAQISLRRMDIIKTVAL